MWPDHDRSEYWRELDELPSDYELPLGIKLLAILAALAFIALGYVS